LCFQQKGTAPLINSSTAITISAGVSIPVAHLSLGAQAG
jgi:hypothetical protein